MSKIHIKNIILYCLRNASNVIALMFTNGSLIQAYLLHSGISSELVGGHSAVLNLVNVVTMMLFSNIADRKGAVIKRIGKCTAVIGLIYIIGVLVILLALKSIIIFVLILISGSVQILFISLRTIYDYKTPYLITNQQYYSRLISVDGIISGLAGVGVSFIISQCMKNFKESTVMFWGFIAAFVFSFVAYCCNNLFSVLEDELVSKSPVSSKTRQSFLIIFKNPLFNKLLVPNLLRGFSSGVITVTAIIGLRNGFTSADTAHLVTFTSLALLIGCVIFGYYSVRANGRIICLIGSLMILALPLLGTKNRILFFGAFFVVSLGKTLVDYSIPLIFYSIIPYEIAASYHSWRMVLTTAGIILASFLVGLISNSTVLLLFLCVTALFQLISGMSFFRFKLPKVLIDE